ncbi:MAG: DEAD/DEAH box helicase family protein [Bacteroidales bacterium]|nr:DEAD/DEAH box helicase family protein [Bacteroidales bacterium]
MSFKDLKNLPKIIDSSNHNIIDDFFVPVLNEAIQYDRGVGYFTSGWLGCVAKGIIPLVERGGKIRLITSPYLHKKDYDAILLGDCARRDEIIYKALSRGIDQLKFDLDEDTRTALSWLIADKIMDIKIAIPKRKLSGGDFHVKFGICKDEEDARILFMGSYNDTVHANSNYEELAIFSSLEASSQPIILQKEVLFERIWQNEDQNITVLDVPKVLIKQFESLRENSKRPYRRKDVKAEKREEKPYSREGYKPWEYQKEAIYAWLNNKMHGILEMATGTGKTKTSLFALCELSTIQNKLIIIIACPTVSLVNQWADECIEFNLKPLICCGENNKWRGQLSDEVAKINLQLRKYLTIVCTHEIIKNKEFKSRIERINREKHKIILIADECHHLGSEGSVKNIYRDYDYTLGLSATPARFFDGAGTKFVESLLGPIVFKYGLSKAIQAGFLCPYEYYIHKVYLNEEEMEEYVRISEQVKKLIGSNKNEIQIVLCRDKRLSGLLNKRAKILKTAKMKIDILKRLLTPRQSDISYAIVFCAPDTDELDKVAHVLYDLNIISHRFTGKENQKEREEILENFENRIYRVLTAMNIFNEGIDVPVGREAFILSSSTNPTEYVQRRGRVLRKTKKIEKEKAIIHDFLVLPVCSSPNTITDIEKQILSKEVKRSFLFAGDAINGLSVMKELNEILDKYL